VGGILAAVTDACLRAGATPVLVRHTNKSAGVGKESLALYDLAYSGVAEFARQWLLVNRRTEYQVGSGAHDLVLSVGGSAGHASCWRVQINEGASDAKRRSWSVSVVRAGEPERSSSGPRRRSRSLWGADEL
jgi:hypothetical protein